MVTLKDAAGDKHYVRTKDIIHVHVHQIAESLYIDVHLSTGTVVRLNHREAKMDALMDILGQNDGMSGKFL
jgi:hypothetical protein